MPEVKVLTCSGCGNIIPPARPGGGAYQGGPVDVVFPAAKVGLDLCTDCLTVRKWTLQELREAGVTSSGGTVNGDEQLAHMPVMD